MTLVTVTPAQAREFVSRWHYSGSAQAGIVRYGWEDRLGRLVGVSIYDNGNHAMRQGVFGPEHYTHVLHHHRLALSPLAPHLTASQFIGASLRALRRDRPDIWAVVTYADTCQDREDQPHRGTIYQATNALFTGVAAKGNLKFRTPDGDLMTTQSLARYGAWPERRAEAARRGWAEVRCRGKNRYVYLLGTRIQRRARPPMLWPVLPYPEKGT